MPEVNKYKTGNKDKDEKKERTQLQPVVEAKIQKKTIGKKLKETFICQDAKEVRHDVTERVIIPTIKDLLYDVGTGILEGLIFGGDRRGSRRSRRRERESPTGYSDIYKYGSSGKTRDVNTYQKRRIDLDDILFDKYGGTLDDRDDALNVVKCLKQRILDFDTALVQDVYDLVGQSSPDYMTVEFGWDSVDEIERGYSINKVRGGYVLSLPPPHRLDK